MSNQVNDLAGFNSDNTLNVFYNVNTSLSQGGVVARTNLGIKYFVIVFFE